MAGMLNLDEIKQLKALEKRLKRAIPHSRKAIAIGRQQGEIIRQARLRQPPCPAMDRLSKAIMRQLP